MQIEIAELNQVKLRIFEFHLGIGGCVWHSGRLFFTTCGWWPAFEADIEKKYGYFGVGALEPDSDWIYQWKFPQSQPHGTIPRILAISDDHLILGIVSAPQFSLSRLAHYLAFTPKQLRDNCPNVWGRVLMDRPGNYDKYEVEAYIEEIPGPFLNEEISELTLKHQPELKPQLRATYYDESHHFPARARDLQLYSPKDLERGSLTCSVAAFPDLSEYCKLLVASPPRTDGSHSISVVRGWQKYGPKDSSRTKRMAMTYQGSLAQGFPEEISIVGLTKYVATHLSMEAGAKIELLDCIVVQPSSRESHLLYLIGRSFSLQETHTPTADFCIEARIELEHTRSAASV